APGELARPQGGPLSASLGPGLLGGVFDGLLRPLTGSGDWLRPGSVAQAPAERAWPFVPRVSEGERLAEGGVVGEIRDGGPIRLRVLVPPGSGGVVERVAGEGAYRQDAVVAVVGGAEVRIGATWPVRRPRPVRERGGEREALNTGQRVIDLLFP
ncbi:ATPase, partial [Streptomyces sp. MCAF7]